METESLFERYYDLIFELGLFYYEYKKTKNQKYLTHIKELVRQLDLIKEKLRELEQDHLIIKPDTKPQF